MEWQVKIASNRDASTDRQDGCFTAHNVGCHSVSQQFSAATIAERVFFFNWHEVSSGGREAGTGLYVLVVSMQPLGHNLSFSRNRWGFTLTNENHMMRWNVLCLCLMSLCCLLLIILCHEKVSLMQEHYKERRHRLPFPCRHLSPGGRFNANGSFFMWLHLFPVITPFFCRDWHLTHLRGQRTVAVIQNAAIIFKDQSFWGSQLIQGSIFSEATTRTCAINKYCIYLGQAHSLLKGASKTLPSLLIKCMSLKQSE